LQAPKSPGRNSNVKLAIGIGSMLGAFPLFFPFVTRFLAIILFLGGIIIYSSGLIENINRERARKQAAAPKIKCRNCGDLILATSKRCIYCGARS
jgi:hypothetical protein